MASRCCRLGLAERIGAGGGARTHGFTEFDLFTQFKHVLLSIPFKI